MINLKNFDIKYIVSALFGILALLISLIAGFFSGNGISVILFRSLITVMIFSIIGLSCAIIIRKYVPEIYQVFNSPDNIETEVKTDEAEGKEAESNPGQSEYIEDSPDAPVTGTPPESREDKDLENEFNTFDKRPDELSGLNEGNSDRKNTLKDKKVVYEPKIAAQAIRTMLKKDE